MDLRRRAILLELAKRLGQLLDLPVKLFVEIIFK
jgi:antitoxin component HigA of HigAB toxin-antitoxin module